MRWDFVVEKWTALLLADAALQSVMGSATGWIYPGQASRPVKIPSIEYTLIYDTERETFNRIGMQVDHWARGIKKSGQIEKRLRLLTGQQTSVRIDGEPVWMRYEDGRTLDYPADPGVIHRALNFEFELVKGLYAAL